MGEDVAALRMRWLDLIRRELPEAARSRPAWPIRLDHCFARVILDAVCGRPWREVVKAPAYKHLGAEQLKQGIAAGGADLTELNAWSLATRNKTYSTAVRTRS